jgi:hypothetical protein
VDEKRLAVEVENAGLHRHLLGTFKGPSSLGVGRERGSSHPILYLMVPPDVTQAFPTHAPWAVSPCQL